MTLRRAVAEAIAAYLLVFIGTGAVMADELTGGSVGSVGIALAFGLTIMAMVYAIGHVSGAHINPAVTIAFWSTRRFPTATVPAYIGAQLAGATLGSATLWWIQAASGIDAQFGVTQPTVPVAAAIAVEFVLTFALMFVIMSVATDERTPTALAGLAIGTVVVFDALMGGVLTGASMNPARSFGPALVAGEWAAHWIYWLGPIAGAVAAAYAYEWIRDVEIHDHEKVGTYGVEGPLVECSSTASPP